MPAARLFSFIKLTKVRHMCRNEIDTKTANRLPYPSGSRKQKPGILLMREQPDERADPI